MTRGVVILGSTGSIGTQALDVISRHPDDYRVVALAAGRNVELLAEQAAHLRRSARPGALRRRRPRGCSPSSPRIPTPTSCSTRSSDSPGSRRRSPRSKRGKRLALANKESLIAAGPVVAKARAAGGGEIVPVDSEHSAIWQCLRSGRHTEVARIILTASGGPFRGRTAAELATVTRADALRHPTWTMGAKITIDSSTLMNKGLEVIEAHELFGVDYDRIDVVVHPQSIVHGMVEFVDGATIAQLSEPRHAPPDRPGARRARSVARRRSGRSTGRRSGTLTFEPPDRTTFRCLDLAYEAGRAGRNGAGDPQRRQRDRGRGIPGRAHRLGGDRRNRRGSVERRHRKRR